MESLNITRDESKALLSVLIDQKEQIEAQTDKLNFRHSRVMSIINELNTMLTGTETKAPAELVDIDWQVRDDRDRLNRLNRALQEEMEINKLSDELFQVVNGNSKIFVVSISGQKGSCTCMDFQKRGQHRAMPCKHLYAVELWWNEKKFSVETEQPVNQSDEGPKCIHCEVAITSAQAQELDDMCQRCWLQRQGTGNGVLVNGGGSDDLL